jgi:hypothetical protein
MIYILLLCSAWTESFETQGFFPPNDWLVANEDALDALWYRDTTAGYTGTHCATIYGDTLYSDLSFTNRDYLITPQVLPQSNDTSIGFWYRASSSAGCSLDVLVSTSSPPAMSSFTLQQTFYISNTSWIHQVVSLSGYSGTSVYVALRIRRVPTQQQVYIDDITLPPATSQTPICNGRLRTKGPPSQKYMQIWGSHYEMGYAHGFLLAEDIMAQFTRWLIGNTNHHMFTPAEWENAILPYWSVRFSVPSKYQQEAQGLYDGLVAKGISLIHPGLVREITVQDILCYNAVADFIMFACSSVSGWGQSTVNDDTLQGGLVMCRDMDFYVGRCMSLTNTSFVIACSPSASDEQEFVSLSIAGLFGCLSGTNREGVGLCMNVGSYADTNYIPPNSLIPIMLSTRDAVETIDPDNSGIHDIFDITYSINHAASLFTWDIHVFSPFNGTHPTPGGILELNNIGDSLRVVANNNIAPQINSQYNLAVTNHHRVLYPPVYCSRYQKMADSLNADFHLTTQRAIAIENAVASEYTSSYGHCTAHQMVFRPNIMVDHSDWPSIGVSYACRMVAAHHFPKTWYSWDELFEDIPGIMEGPSISAEFESNRIITSILAGRLLLPRGKKCKVFDITGRVVEPDKIAPGIYFLEIDNKIVEKVVKIR